MKVEYVKQNLDNLNENLARKCAQLYCQVWKEPPWCEDFWQAEDVLANLKVELAKPRALCWLATSARQEVIGFSWGYGVNRDDLTKISGNSQLAQSLNGTAELFYVDELGVNIKKRQHGVGKRLTRQLIDYAANCGYSKIILRTDIRAIPARTLYAHLGFKELTVQDSAHQTRNYWLLQM